MNIKIINNFNKGIEKEDTEMVERKGIGHPDSLADLIAETFSNKYSKYCLKNFSTVLNHGVDRIVLSGAKADISFGKAKVLKPINIYLFGKMALGVGEAKINISKIFRESVNHVFTRIFKNKEILKYINYVIDINDGVGLEHPREFYMPGTIVNFKKIKDLEVANDTVVCSAYAGYSRAESLVIEIENYINSNNFKSKFSETGYDVKVLIVRVKDEFDITVCLPFIARYTKSFPFYKHRLIEAKEDIREKIAKLIKGRKFNLYMNTKDRACYGYITVFGTALDKGDYGIVGRGNKYNGVISLSRGASPEAVSGKNPVHHVGKLYNVISQDIANEIYKKFRVENYINIATKNGLPLINPPYIVVKLCGGSINKSIIETIINKKIKNIKKYTNKIVRLDPVYEFHVLKSIKML